MNAATVLQYVLAALQIAPAVVTDIAGFQAWQASLALSLKTMQDENRDPNATEWAALNAQLLAQLNALAEAKPAEPVPLAPEPIGETVEQVDQAAVGS